MPPEINITDDDIAFAERLLLPEGKTFDDERRAFIRRFDTLDLQAIPGSGKTTALLAKLVILERYLPFEDGSAILVISHTNAAVDEIKKKVGGHCPRLFSYPNYVATIQGFVDRFLAVPYYASRKQKRPTRIDNETYSEVIGRFRKIQFSKERFSTAEQNSGRHYLIANERKRLATTYRLALIGGEVKLTRGVCGNELVVSKPRGTTLPNNYYDWSDQEKGRVELWLKELKYRVLDEGILCYDDAYFLADCYVSRIPQSKTLIQNRFRFVFVDEMQDMGRHQYELLERLFFDNGSCRCGYQRIGDRNQAIHDSRDFEVEGGWQDRGTVLSLSNSCRLSPLTAKVIESFALHRPNQFRINGLGTADIKPHLILYADSSRHVVIERFSSLLSELMTAGRIPRHERSSFTAVAWNSEWKDGEDKSDPNGVRLVDYCSSFRKAGTKPPVDHDCLETYLKHFDRTHQTLRAACNSVLNLFLKVLRLEDIRNSETEKYFTAKSLLRHLRDCHYDFYEDFKLRLYQWSLAAVKDSGSDVATEIRSKIPELLLIFGKTVDGSRAFLAQLPTERPVSKGTDRDSVNNVNLHGFDIELATVHSVKGQTHTATLYLETYFDKDGSGANAKSYESQRLASQFLLNPLEANERRKRVKQSAKMVYVGFSRPTHLLCFAVHKDRFEQYLTDIDPSVWEVIRLDEENLEAR